MLLISVKVSATSLKTIRDEKKNTDQIEINIYLKKLGDVC